MYVLKHYVRKEGDAMPSPAGLGHPLHTEEKWDPDGTAALSIWLIEWEPVD